MKNHPLLFVLVLLGGLFVAAFDGSARAESIAIVDLERVLNQSSAAQGIRQQMEGRIEDFQAWGRGQEEAFQSEAEEFETQRAVLSPEVMQQRGQDLQNRIAEFQVEAQRRDQGIRQAGANAQQELENVLVAVVADVARAQGISLIMPKSTLLFAGPDVLDVTEAALAQLNTQLPSISVTFGD